MTMFRSNLEEKLKTIEDTKNELDVILQNAMKETDDNVDLEFIQLDFTSNFHPVFYHLREMHRLYKLCCQTFDEKYVEYLKTVSNTKDDAKLSDFQKMIRQWEGKVLLNYMVKVNINHVQNRLQKLADKNGVLLSIINEIKETGTMEANQKAWLVTREEAIELFEYMLQNLPKKECTELMDEFSKDLKTFDSESKKQ